MNTYEPSWRKAKVILLDSVFSSAICLAWSHMFIYLYLVFKAEENGQIDATATTQLDILLIVLFSPVVESMLLGMQIKSLKNCQLSSRHCALICALTWGLIHGIFDPFWAVTSSFSFFVMAQLFLKHATESRASAYLAILLTHILINSIAVLFYF
jgi:hypothetical protein